ncbi:MAG: transcriptional regulator [Dehalococcoidia bacterium]
MNPYTEYTTHLSLVTIVAEAILEPRLVRELKALGVTGFTVSAAHGEGSRGSRAGDIEGGNVKIETIVQPELAAVLLNHVEANYFEHYAVIVWVSEVGVLRGDKYL